MNGPDIDGTLPGQDIEEESSEDEVRRESDSTKGWMEANKSTQTVVDSMNWDGDGDGYGWRDEESLRGWFYFTAGACSGLLVVYLILVLYYEFDIPYLYEEDHEKDYTKNLAIATSLVISVMVYVTIWFFMSGKNHSFFTEDPDKAKFYAGIMLLASLVIIVIFSKIYPREMTISAILTSVSTWSYIRSSQMK